MQQQQDIQLQKDCEATRIPSGEVVLLSQGEVLTLTQALGGSVTLKNSNGLFRIGLEQVDALGDEIAASVREAAASVPDDAPFSEDLVWNALRQCFDPEIPVNIVDLGLIYDLNSEEVEASKFHIEVRMTLTATGCGMGPTIAADAKSKIEALSSVKSANVEIVWDPQWNPRMISDTGRQILGLN